MTWGSPAVQSFAERKTSEMEDKQEGGRTREHRMAEARDERELPTITVLRSDLDLIAQAFEGRAVPVARSIYFALIEISSKPGALVTRQSLAATAGVTPKALRDYAPQLQALGLVVVEQRADEKGATLPTLWRLTTPGGCTAGEGWKPGGSPLPSSTNTASAENDKDKVGEPAVHPLLPESMEADVVALLKGKRRVGGKLVTEDEMRKAAVALAAFNAAQGGADHGLGANLEKLVGRIRERPSWDALKLVRLVESAWRHKWWENSGRGRRPTPAVVFGNANVFEQVAMDAAADAAGTPVEDTPERKSRYTRTLEPE